jgi:hypothetical protein
VKERTDNVGINEEQGGVMHKGSKEKAIKWGRMEKRRARCKWGILDATLKGRHQESNLEAIIREDDDPHQHPPQVPPPYLMAARTSIPYR